MNLIKKKTLIPFAFLFFTIALSIYIGNFAFSPQKSINIANKCAYWITFASVVAFFYSIYAVIKDFFQNNFSLKNLKHFVPSALVIVASIAFIRSNEKDSYKIVMDEPVLVGTSVSMHLDRQILLPGRTHYINNAYYILGGNADKRPLMFPFFLSLFHDFFGLNGDHAFTLNFIFTIFFILIAYGCGFLIAEKAGGISMVLLFASLPLLRNTSHSAGFELMNLTFLALVFLLSICHLKNPTKTTLSALLCSNVILSNIRYESVIYWIPVSVVIILPWLKNKSHFLHWSTFFTPLFMIPYLWIHKTFELNRNHWQMFEHDQNQAPFDLKFLKQNYPEALKYFFDFDKNSPNSPLIAISGFIALIFFILYILKKIRSKSEFSTEEKVITQFIILGFIPHLVMLLTYFLSIDNVIVRRLSFPLYFHLSVLIVWFVYKIYKNTQFSTIYSWILGIFLCTVSLPFATAQKESNPLSSIDSTNCILSFAQKHRFNKDIIVVSSNPFIFAAYGISSLGNGFDDPNFKKLVLSLIKMRRPPIVLFHENVSSLKLISENDKKTPPTKGYDSSIKRVPFESFAYSKITGIMFFKITDIDGVTPDSIDFDNQKLEDVLIKYVSHLP